MYVLSFQCTLGWVALKVANLCQYVMHFHVLAAITDVITYGYRVRLEFWKGVRQTEMAYVDSGWVYVLSYQCTLCWVASNVVDKLYKCACAYCKQLLFLNLRLPYENLCTMYVLR